MERLKHFRVPFFFFFLVISPKIKKPAFSEKHVNLIAEKCWMGKFYLLFPPAKSNLKVLLWDSSSVVISHEISLDYLHGQQIFLEHQNSSPLPSTCVAVFTLLLRPHRYKIMIILRCTKRGHLHKYL